MHTQLLRHPILPFVSVIVITKNNVDTIEKCILSLLDQSYPEKNLEIIFVDGHSTDGTDKIIEKYVKKTFVCNLFYENSGTMGFARNVGVSKSKGSIIAFTDADAFVPNDWLEKIVAVFLEFQPVALGGIDILVYEGESEKIIDSWRRLKKKEGPKAIPCIKTVNFAIRKETLLSCGGFDPELSHFDETELLARLYSKTDINRVIYDPNIVVYHKRPTSITITSRIKKSFNKSHIGTSVLFKRHVIRIALKNPTSPLAISFYLILLCIVTGPIFFISTVKGFFLIFFIFVLFLYLALVSLMLIGMFRQTKKVTYALPLLLTIDVIGRFGGTFLGLIETVEGLIRRKKKS